MTDVLDSKLPIDNKESENVINEPTNLNPKSTNYIVVGILVIVLVILIYYAYQQFTENKEIEPEAKPRPEPTDDTVIDFNLRESIEELRGIQKKIVQGLSENADI